MLQIPPIVARERVHFVRGNVHEAMDAELFRHLEQNECSFDVCLDRRRRIIDAAIGVGLRSEMNYGIAICIADSAAAGSQMSPRKKR